MKFADDLVNELARSGRLRDHRELDLARSAIAREAVASIGGRTDRPMTEEARRIAVQGEIYFNDRLDAHKRDQRTAPSIPASMPAPSDDVTYLYSAIASASDARSVSRDPAFAALATAIESLAFALLARGSAADSR